MRLGRTSEQILTICMSHRGVFPRKDIAFWRFN